MALKLFKALILKGKILKEQRMSKTENRKAFSFIAPSILGVSLFFIIPFVMSLGYATTNMNGEFVGMNNFQTLFASDAFKLAAWNTLKFMIIAIPLNIFIPLFIGCLIFKVTGGEWLKTIFISPLIVPSACAAFFFQSLFTSNGLLSGILGVNTDWLQTEASFSIAVGVYVSKNMGFNLVLILAGLANIPKDYYEWAAVEGMSGIQMFFKITMVNLIPTLFITTH